MILVHDAVSLLLQTVVCLFGGYLCIQMFTKQLGQIILKVEVRQKLPSAQVTSENET